MVMVCIQKKTLQMFNYLLNECPQAGRHFSFTKLKIIYEELARSKWIDGLESFFTGSTLQSVFRSLTTQGKLQLIEELFESLIDNNELSMLKTTSGVLLPQALLNLLSQ